VIIKHVSDYYPDKDLTRTMPIFFIEDLELSELPLETISEGRMLDQDHGKGTYKNQSTRKDLQTTFRKVYDKELKKIVKEINEKYLPELLQGSRYNTWGRMTEEVTLGQGYAILKDEPGFLMAPHIDNREVGSVMSLNIRDNPVGTKFYNLSELEVLHYQKNPGWKKFKEDRFMFEGPKERGTGVLWWNHNTTMHGIENDSSQDRYTIYSITPIFDYFRKRIDERVEQNTHKIINKKGEIMETRKKPKALICGGKTKFGKALADRLEQHTELTVLGTDELNDPNVLEMVDDDYDKIFFNHNRPINGYEDLAKEGIDINCMLPYRIVKKQKRKAKIGWMITPDAHHAQGYPTEMYSKEEWFQTYIVIKAIHMSMQRSFSEDHNTFVADPGGITPENTEDKVTVIVTHLMSDEELELLTAY
tara:strand:- start:382 stop:1638 length:1257 start_codon:yes stop_codon:yes gene_type:complete